jgi:hypothetical protein
MSERRLPSQPDEALRRLANQVVPVDDTGRVERRREQVVSALSRAIRETSESKRRALRARLVWGLGLAASLCLGIGFAVSARHSTLNQGQVGTTVAVVHGAVVVTQGGDSRALSPGAALALGAFGEIETAPDAQAEIRSQKSVVHLGPATKLGVPQATSLEERYRLALGRVDVSVDKNSRLARSVVVETANAEVVVHGTVFAVGVRSRAGHLMTEVSVTRGSVWVLANGVQVAVLGPGQVWSSEAPPAVAPAPAAAMPVPAASETAVVREAVRSVRHQSAAPAESRASTLAEQARLFQEAIDARNRFDDARAVELFTRLLARFPSYEEAEVQLFRAQGRLGHTAAAAAEARHYLGQHPQGFAHEEARVLALSSVASAH